MRKNSNSIQAHLSKMGNIMREPSFKAQIGDSPAFDSLIQSINQLSQTQPEQGADAINDTAGDSLEKVNYYIDLALNTFERINASAMDEQQQANFFFALSETFETLGNYNAALRNYSSLLRLSETLKDESKRGQIQYRVGRIYADRGEWQQAEKMLKEAIHTLKTTNRHSEIALAQIELAKIAYRKGDYLKAEDIFQSALLTSDSIKDIRSRATVSNHLGIIRRILGEYDLAYNHFHQALLEFQGIQDFRGTAESLNNLGVVHLRRHELQKAMSYFEKSQHLCQEIGYFTLVAFIYLNKAEYYCEFGDIPMAANICCKALEYIIRLKNPIGIAKISMLFGRILWKSSDFETADKFYRTSMDLYEEFSIPLGLANSYKEYGQMLAARGSHEQANSFQSKAQELYGRLNMQPTDIKKARRRIDSCFIETKPDVKSVQAAHSS